MQEKIINSFTGKNIFLSNFQRYGKENLTVEHHFQAAKAVDEDDYNYVMSSETPVIAKKRGRDIIKREDWEEIKANVMYSCLVDKFTTPEFKEKLINTGNAYLEEGNTWHDNHWGNCTCDKCESIIGGNLLGLLLIRVRHELKMRRI